MKTTNIYDCLVPTYPPVELPVEIGKLQRKAPSYVPNYEAGDVLAEDTEGPLEILDTNTCCGERLQLRKAYFEDKLRYSSSKELRATCYTCNKVYRLISSSGEPK